MVEELEKIAWGEHKDWQVITRNYKGERRWGFDEEVVFTDRNRVYPFYAFTYYVSVGDSEVEFMPSEVYEVEPNEITVTEWKRV